MKRAEKLGAKVSLSTPIPARRAAVLRQPGDQRCRRQVRRRNTGRDHGRIKGKVAIVSAQPTRPTRTPGSPRSSAEIKKYPDIEVVDKVYGYDNEQKAFDLTVALTTKYPDLAGIFAPTCPGLPAVARALESVNKGKGVIKLVGHCVPSITAKYMLDGTIEGFYLWNPVKLGYITYYAAKYLAEGKIQGKPGEFLHDRQGQVAGHLQ